MFPFKHFLSLIHVDWQVAHVTWFKRHERKACITYAHMRKHGLISFSKERKAKFEILFNMASILSLSVVIWMSVLHRAGFGKAMLLNCKSKGSNLAQYTQNHTLLPSWYTFAKR
jgi:hypothetical protein